jgi:hypothetical protein
MNLKFKGKWGVILLPFLTKILMDANTKAPFNLLTTTCKALLEMDASLPKIVHHPEPDKEIEEEDNEEAEEESTRVMDIFFRVVQFLALVTHRAIPNPVVLNMLTTSWPHDQATSVATINGVAMTGLPGGTLDKMTRGFANLGASLNHFANEMKNNNAILANKAEKEAKKSKVGQVKFVDFILKMILNASEPITEDMTDVNGDPIMSRGELVESYQNLLECSSVGQMRKHLQHYMNDKKGCSSVLPLSMCNAIFSGKL